MRCVHGVSLRRSCRQCAELGQGRPTQATFEQLRRGWLDAFAAMTDAELGVELHLLADRCDQGSSTGARDADLVRHAAARFRPVAPVELDKPAALLHCDACGMLITGNYRDAELFCGCPGGPRQATAHPSVSGAVGRDLVKAPPGPPVTPSDVRAAIADGQGRDAAELLESDPEP